MLLNFYNGLLLKEKSNLDVAIGGSLMNESAADGYKLVDDMSLNQSQWQNTKEAVRASEGGAYEIDSNSKLAAKVIAIKRQIEQMSVESVTLPPCSI
jgi:hypothetical protein